MTPKIAANTLAYMVLFLLGIMVGHSFQKVPIEVIERPIVYQVEEDCFMDNEGERLQLKRLTMNDLENM